MNKYLSLTGIVLASGAMISCKLTQKDIRADRPNILFVVADDASYPHFGANGCPWVDTPGFDRIAREGILFSNCYTPNAKSAPSRACMLTGLYSWQLREAGNHLPKFPSDIKVVTETLQEVGYHIGFTGKGWAPGDAGQINGKQRELTGAPYQRKKMTSPTPQISTTDYTANFMDFLDDHQGTDPWFFWVGFFEPHRAYQYGSGIELGRKTIEMIDQVPVYWPDNETVRTDMLDYAFEIEYLDKHLMMMIDELEKRGLLDNTIIVFTSDNGMPFPRSKANNYELSNHMPLAVMWKNGIVNPGREVADYVNFVDFTPTFLEVSGIEPARSGMQQPAGRSLTDIFQNGKEGITTSYRNFTLLGRERHDYGRPGNQGYPIRSIIKDGLLYINNMKPDLFPGGNPETGYLDCDGSPTKSLILNMRREGSNDWYWRLSFGKRQEEELYNLKADKDCLINLAEHPLYGTQKEEMKTMLFTMLRQQGDPRMFGAGDVFDQYPFDQDINWNFWERVQSGEISEPWKQTGWVNPTDYETYQKIDP
jgi:arylsulfatase A-like enzyme